jgi:hypothetical protein
MPRLQDFEVTNFNGGLVTNKSDYEMDRNEFKDLANWDVDTNGRLTRRRGFQLFGNALGKNLSAAITYRPVTTITSKGFIVFENGSSANAYSLITTSLTANVAAGDTTISVTNNTSFAASGTIEIGGDIITYTSKPSSTSFAVTGSTILKTHFSGTSVNQWNTAVDSGIDTRAGVYNAFLASTMFVCGFQSRKKISDAATPTFSSVSGAPDILFATTYNNRIFGAGDSGAGTNGLPIRLSWSNRGTSDTWTSSDSVDIEDALGEMITGLKVLGNHLLVFKQNSMFRFELVDVQQVSDSVGAYNHFVTQEIDGLVYTFCPSGVFVTNGESIINIGEPVRQYLKSFRPQYETTYNRVITNCFSGQFENKYILYLGTLRFPSQDFRQTTKTGVCLVYDIIRKNWTAYEGVSPASGDFVNFLSATSFAAGDTWQGQPAIFGISGATGNVGQVFRMFENSEIGNSASYQERGGPIAPDKIQDSAGVAVSTLGETPFYDMNAPQWFKSFGYLTVLMNEGEVLVQYKLETDEGETDWQLMGTARKDKKKLPFKKDYSEGYRVAFRFSSSERDTLTSFDGFVVHEIEAVRKR